VDRRKALEILDAGMAAGARSCELATLLQQCLQRVDAIDAALQEEQEARIAIEQLRQQLAAVAEGTDALDSLLPL
jgi:ABC-type hemin transport system substrate-binding protein